jgi:hypothetical protein
MARFMGVAAMEIPVCVSETNNGMRVNQDAHELSFVE